MPVTKFHAGRCVQGDQVKSRHAQGADRSLVLQAPDNDLPRVYLQSGLHGFEKSAKHAAMRWFQGVIRSNHSSMAYLRKAVTIVWVPTASPSSYISGLRKN